MRKGRILLIGWITLSIIAYSSLTDGGKTQDLEKVGSLPKATQPSSHNQSSDFLIPKLGLFPKYGRPSGRALSG